MKTQPKPINDVLHARVAFTAGATFLIAAPLLITWVGLSALLPGLLAFVLGSLMAYPLITWRYAIVAVPALHALGLFLLLTLPNIKPEVQAGSMIGFYLGIASIALCIMGFRHRKRAAVAGHPA